MSSPQMIRMFGWSVTASPFAVEDPDTSAAGRGLLNAQGRILDAIPVSSVNCAHRVSWLVGRLRVLSQHPIDRGSADSESSSDGARRFATTVHPAGKVGLRLVERPGSSYGLPACPTRLPCGCASFSAKLKFKLGQACKDTGYHPPRRV